MGHNPSRYQINKRLALEDRLDVDAYKARSAWGRWWQLEPMFRARHFSQDEIRWIRRYGSRLDQLACGTVESRNDNERHFVEVCGGRAEPRTERERLWLRVQALCRFEDAIEKAALYDQAMELAVGLTAENEALRVDLRDAEEVARDAVFQMRWRTGDEYVKQQRSIQNVEWVTWQFRVPETAGPPRHYSVARPTNPRWISQIFPAGRSAVDQGPMPATVDVFAYQTSTAQDEGMPAQ